MMSSSDFETLRARALDPTLDLEARLLAFWRLSAEHWRRRTMRIQGEGAGGYIGEDDADAATRQRYEDGRKLRRIKKAIAAGSNRVRKVTGALVVVEAADALHNHICEFCGAGYSPNRPYPLKGRPPMYCSAACKAAAYRARKAA